jgi:hypothetical protein
MWHVWGKKLIGQRVFVGKPVVKRSLERPRRRYKDNVNTDLTEIMWEGVYWVYVARDKDIWWAVAHTVVNIRVP